MRRQQGRNREEAEEAGVGGSRGAFTFSSQRAGQIRGSKTKGVSYPCVPTTRLKEYRSQASRTISITWALQQAVETALQIEVQPKEGVCILQERSGIFRSFSQQHLCCDNRIHRHTGPKGCENGSEDCFLFEAGLEHAVVLVPSKGEPAKGHL